MGFTIGIVTRNSNKNRMIICVMELKYYIYKFNQSVIWRVQEIEAIRHLGALEVIRHMLR